MVASSKLELDVSFCDINCVCHMSSKRTLLRSGGSIFYQGNIFFVSREIQKEIRHGYFLCSPDLHGVVCSPHRKTNFESIVLISAAPTWQHTGFHSGMKHLSDVKHSVLFQVRTTMLQNRKNLLVFLMNFLISLDLIKQKHRIGSIPQDDYFSVRDACAFSV